MTTNFAAIVIDGYGGPTAVARLFRCRQPSVSYWKASGIIPRARLDYLLDIPKHRRKLKALGVLKEALELQAEGSHPPPALKKAREKLKPGPKPKPKPRKRRRGVKAKPKIIPVLWKNAKAQGKEWV